MKISIVMPVHQRADLLRFGLQSIRLSNYNQEDVEIIVVDASSTDMPDAVCDLWDAHYVRIDPYKSDLEVPKEVNINPCLQQNVGIQMAGGDIIIMTSPEVVFAKETLTDIVMAMQPGTSVYAKVFEPTDMGWFPVSPDDWTYDILNALPHGIPYNFDIQGNNKLSAYFLGAFWHDTIDQIRGIDEQYIKGIAWEDEDFGLRMASIDRPVYREDIIGVHLHHPRTYQVQHRIDLNMAIMEEKGFMVPRYHGNYTKVPNVVANHGRTWGNLALVTSVAANFKDGKYTAFKKQV